MKTEEIKSLKKHSIGCTEVRTLDIKAGDMKSKDKYCAVCTLPASFPGIYFDRNGVCNFCIESRRRGDQKEKKTEYRLKFESLIEKYRGKSDYDALMCYSGGKDSTYTMVILKERYNLNVLAMSFDNGFVSEQAVLNIHNVVEELGIDHVFIKPRFDMLAKIFLFCAENDVFSPKALERSSAICTSCMGIIKYSALRLAIEKHIPFIIYGWSPGQAPIHSSILKNNPDMIRIMQKIVFDQLHQIAGDVIKPYFLDEQHFNLPDRFPYNINPLAFLDYTLEEIYKNIQQFNWEKPQDTGKSSTNCLLNPFACVVHKQKLGYHPYAFEIANLVREGYLNRTVALKRLNEQEDAQILSYTKKKLQQTTINRF